MLGNLGGAFWGVLGALVWPTGALREVLGYHAWPTGALGEVLGDACTRLEGPQTRQGGPLGAAKACMIANDDGKSNGFLMILKNDVFSKEGSRGPGDKMKNAGFYTLRVPGGVLGGVSSRLVGPWGLQEPSSRFFLAPGGSPWSGQGMHH